MGDLRYDETDTVLRAQFLRPLNTALKEISERDRTLIKELQFAGTTDVFKYVLPVRFLAMYGVRYKDRPPLHRTSPRNIYHKRYSRTSGTPETYALGEKTESVRLTGTATGGSNTDLQDTTATFTTWVKVGDIVLNDTDDSEATATAVAATQVDFTGTAALAGGSDNVFAALDTYTILSRAADRFSVLIDPAPSETDAAGTENFSLVFAETHVDITQAMMDNSNDEVEIAPEFRGALIHLTTYWFLPAGSPERQNAQAEFENQYSIHYPNVKSRNEEMISAWENNWTSIYPRYTAVGFNRTLPTWYTG